MLMGAGSALSNHPSSYSTVVLFVVGGITFQEVSILQNMYREKGIEELDDDRPFSAAESYVSAAWLYRAIGDVYLAEALETKAESVREETRMKKTEEEGA